MKIFLDTNFVVGLYATTDSLHQESIRVSKEIKKFSKAKLFISNYVVAEILTILSQKAGKEICLDAGKRIFEKKIFEIIHSDYDSDLQTWELIKTVHNKDLSFVDLSILVTIKNESIDRLVTFDKKLTAMAREQGIVVLA